MQMVFILWGLPGSGKSTWSSKQGLPVVSRDEARIALGFCKEGEKYRGTKEKEDKVTEWCNNQYDKLLKNGESFIIDNTNLKRNFRKAIIDKVHRESGAKVIGVIFNTPLDVCISRREGQIPADRMREIYANAEPLLSGEVDSAFVETGE